MVICVCSAVWYDNIISEIIVSGWFFVLLVLLMRVGGQFMNIPLFRERLHDFYKIYDFCRVHHNRREGPPKYADAQDTLAISICSDFDFLKFIEKEIKIDFNIDRAQPLVGQ